MTMNTIIPRRREWTPPHGRDSAVEGWEHYRGYGVMALPFDSGHVLALRVMPENDFASVMSVWHRTPDGDWSMYVDAPMHQEFCPRLYGPALARSGPASIAVSWFRGRRIRVWMDEPRLDWSLDLRSSPLTRLVNAGLGLLPLAVYRRRPTLAVVRAVADRALDLGPVDLRGRVPGGQEVLVKPRKIHLVSDSWAVLGGEELGSPVRAEENPATGSFTWPALGVLAEGDVFVKIRDQEDHARRRAAFRRPLEALAAEY